MGYTNPHDLAPSSLNSTTLPKASSLTLATPASLLVLDHARLHLPQAFTFPAPSPPKYSHGLAPSLPSHPYTEVTNSVRTFQANLFPF